MIMYHAALAAVLTGFAGGLIIQNVVRLRCG